MGKQLGTQAYHGEYKGESTEQCGHGCHWGNRAVGVSDGGRCHRDHKHGQKEDEELVWS